MFNAIKNFFKTFWAYFRPGFEQFCKDQIEDAMEFLQEIWINAGKPLNLVEFEPVARSLFFQRYGEKSGSWASALLYLAWDALKNSGVVKK
jgi:hypothetical protein